MSKYWNDRTRSLDPYVPGEQPKDRAYIKLNTNENPYPPSPRVLEAIREAANDDLRLYPDPNADGLRAAIADGIGVSPDRLFVGNGSDEVLAFAFAGLFRDTAPILFPDITYSFYPVYAKLYGLSYETVPVDEAFRIPLDRFHPDNGGIIIPNPNAPTALYEPVEHFRALLERNPDSVVVLDEAYIDFGGESAVPLIREYPNLLVVQTLSKSRSLAGLRLGFAVGQPELIEGLNRIKNSFNSYPIDRLALAGAAAAFADREYFERTRRQVMATRERTVAALRDIGFRVVESSANFVLAGHPDRDAGELFRQLKAQGVLVRYFRQPRIDGYLRISIGTDAEMDACLNALRSIVGATA